MASSLPPPDPTSMTDSCPFNSLHPNVEWEILKQLNVYDYNNLAFTCHKWFHVASTAPRSVKPNLVVDYLRVSYSGFEADIEGKCLRRNMLCTPHAKLTCLEFVNKISCKTIYIDGEMPRRYEKTDYRVSDFLKLLASNRNSFETKRVEINLPFIKPRETSMNRSLDSILDMAPRLLMSREYGRGPHPEHSRWLFTEYAFSQKHLSYTHIKNMYAMDLDIVNLVLKQWIRGERRNLEEFFSMVFQRNDYWDQIISGVEEFVKDKVFRRPSTYTANVVVPGLPVLVMSVTFMKKVRFTRVVE